MDKQPSTSQSTAARRMFAPLGRLLCLPGLQYITTRFGSNALRRWSFDEKFRTEEWNFTPSPELVQTVERHAKGGPILMLGCGTGSIATALKPDCFESFLGVDLSPEAIARAQVHASHKIRFEAGDMLRFDTDQKFSVILFSESLYYISAWRRLPLLTRAARMLTPDGRIVVTVAQPSRFARMLRMLRKNFDVSEDRNFSGSTRHLIVFH